MTWSEMCDASIAAAQLLRNHHADSAARSSISRSYYAAYYEVIGQLGAVAFGRGRQNPSHAAAIRQVMKIARLSIAEKYQVQRSLKVLYKARVEADYFRQAPIDLRVAIDALREARRIIDTLRNNQR